MKSSFLRKTCSSFRILCEEGPAEFLKVLLKKIYFKYEARWFVCDLTKPIKKLYSGSGDFKVLNNLFEETISWMEALQIPGIATQREIENMRKCRQLSYTLLFKDQTLGYINVGKDVVYVVDFDSDIHFPPKAAFVIDTFIHYDHRGKKLFHLLISAVKEDLHEKGYERLYCHIRNDNKISISAYRKNDFAQMGTVLFRRIMGKRIIELPQI